MNKIDLPQADPDKVRKEIEEIIGIDASDCPEISAKNGQGIDNLLEQLVVQVPPPDDADDSLQALIIDSWFDQYLGVVSLIRIFSGSMDLGQKLVQIIKFILLKKLVYSLQNLKIENHSPKEMLDLFVRG